MAHQSPLEKGMNGMGKYRGGASKSALLKRSPSFDVSEPFIAKFQCVPSGTEAVVSDRTRTFRTKIPVDDTIRRAIGDGMKAYFEIKATHEGVEIVREVQGHSW